MQENSVKSCAEVKLERKLITLQEFAAAAPRDCFFCSFLQNEGTITTQATSSLHFVALAKLLFKYSDRDEIWQTRFSSLLLRQFESRAPR